MRARGDHIPPFDALCLFFFQRTIRIKLNRLIFSRTPTIYIERSRATMAVFRKPGWYMRLRYSARRAIWEIRGDYEEPEYYLLPFLVDPDRAAIDVGGNYGSYAGKLAKLTRRVHCFEPNPDSATGLRARMPASVVVHQAAASRRN